MKRPLIVANWKAYITSFEEAAAVVRVFTRKAKDAPADFVICPPTPFLSALGGYLKGKSVALGAQHVSNFVDEKRTGENTARMLYSTGARFVIVGHSERRAQGETNADISQAVERALQAKLVPIVCVGESERNASGEHFAKIESQLRESLPKLVPQDAKKITVAYEPLWAIGKTAADAITPDVLEETVIFIRKVLTDVFGRATAVSIRILYGGSVEKENAQPLMLSGVAGFLVGHASIEPKSLLDIGQAAATLRKK